MNLHPQHAVDVFLWPAASSDFSPMLGHWISRRLTPPNNQNQLVQAAHAEWAVTPQARTQRLIDSMQDRVTPYICVEGGKTRY